MIFDFPTGDGAESFESDVCVVGAGLAGLGFSLRFLGKRTSVLILEAGGPTRHSHEPDPFKGEVVDLPYFPLHKKRIRCFGGSSTAWGGACARLTTADFARQDWLEHSGWPLTEDDLSPHYHAANMVLGLGDYHDQPNRDDLTSSKILSFDPRVFQHRMYAYATPPTDLGVKYWHDFARSANVKVMLRATVTEIVVEPKGGVVSGVRVAAPGGEKSVLVRARLFVLALGGLETPRLLLNSDRHGDAVGNAHDLVGRFFMDHLYAVGGRVSGARGRWPRTYRRFAAGSSVRQQYAVGLADEVRRRERVLSACVRFGRSIPLRARSRGYQALGRLRQVLKTRCTERLTGTELQDIAGDLHDLAGAVRELLDPSTYLIILSEQAPDPDNRVTLGDARDQFGLRRLKLHWRLNDIDKHTVRVIISFLDREIARLGAGRVIRAGWLNADDEVWARQMAGGSHHMGTTRMAADPKHGVVDADCRVHGLDNLYITGPSVFPTGGYANPAYTIVLLAFRLAEHLDSRLTEATSPPLDPHFIQDPDGKTSAGRRVAATRRPAEMRDQGGNQPP